MNLELYRPPLLIWNNQWDTATKEFKEKTGL